MDNILRIRIPFLTQDVRIDTNFKVIAQQINALPRDNTISDEKIKDGTISQKKLSFTLTEMGTLDDLNDGAYGKILSTEISAGHINLMAVSVVDPSFTTDKIGEGDSHKWDTGIPPTILDQLADGTYKKVLAADFTAEHIKLAAITQDTTHRVVTDTEKGTWNGKPDDMDAIGQGSTYWKLAQTEIEAGHIRLSTAYGTLDNIANGADYGKVALTSIGAGKIIVAGLDNDVIARMFADGDAKTNIEAWRHASDVTLIDGGDIYADSITLGSIKSDAFSSLANRNLIQNSSFDKDVSDTWPMTYWDCDKTGGTFYSCSNWAATENHKKYPWDFVFYCHVAAENNDGSQYVLLKSSEYIPVDITKPYTLSTWIKRHGDVLRWYLGLYFYDSDKVACDPTFDLPASMNGITTTGTAYTHYSGTFGPGMDVEFPANCRYVKIRFHPMYNYGSGSSIGSMSTGLQFEPGDHVTDWKPYLLPEKWMHGSDATYIDGGKIYTHSINTISLIADSITTKYLKLPFPSWHQAIYKVCPSYKNGSFDSFIQEYFAAGTGASGGNYYWYRAYSKFNLFPLFGRTLTVAELRWILADKGFAGSGANAQIPLRLHAVDDYGTPTKDDWDLVTKVDYGIVNVYTDTTGNAYSEDIKTRIQALINAETPYAAFRFTGQVASQKITRYHTPVNSDIGGYYVLGNSPAASAGILRADSPGNLAGALATPSGNPNVIKVLGSTNAWSFYFYIWSGYTNDTVTWRWRLYKRTTPGVETEINNGTFNSVGTGVQQVAPSITLPETAMDVTDRLVLKLWHEASAGAGAAGWVIGTDHGNQNNEYIKVDIPGDPPTEPADPNNANNYRISEPWLYVEF